MRADAAVYRIGVTKIIGTGDAAAGERSPHQGRELLLQRRDDISLSEGEKKELVGFHDAQLERAADALKGVMIYAARK